MSVVSTTPRKAAAVLGVSALALTSSAAGAFAQDTPEYPPPPPPSSAQAACVGDIPYISYQANFPPEFAGEPVTITINNPTGDDIVVTKTLGPDGSVSGNDILWPGASESPPDWPGWILQDDGTWVEGDDGFLWARGTITGTFEVNPTVALSATYPPPTSICAGPPNSDNPPPENPPGETPPTTTTTSSGLPSTGAQTATLGLVGGGLLVGGTALVVSSRRRTARSEV
jgi:LPXTG-motif cell wall-anchored protein